MRRERGSSLPIQHGFVGQFIEYPNGSIERFEPPDDVQKMIPVFPKPTTVRENIIQKITRKLQQVGRVS